MTADPDFDIDQVSEQSDCESNESYCTQSTVDEFADQCFIVYGRNLFNLLKFCLMCGNPVIEETKKKQIVGSMVKVQFECLSGHDITWCSQPQIGKLPLGDLAMIAGVSIT